MSKQVATPDLAAIAVIEENIASCMEAYALWWTGGSPSRLFHYQHLCTLIEQKVPRDPDGIRDYADELTAIYDTVHDFKADLEDYVTRVRGLLRSKYRNQLGLDGNELKWVIEEDENYRRITKTCRQVELKASVMADKNKLIGNGMFMLGAEMKANQFSGNPRSGGQSNQQRRQQPQTENEAPETKLG